MKYLSQLLRLLASLTILCFSVFMVKAQQVQWTIVTPAANSIIGNQNLFIQVVINNTCTFEEGTVQVLLDGRNITVLIRTNANKLNIIYEAKLADGKHHIEIKARIPEVKRFESVFWDFFVNRTPSHDEPAPNANGVKQKEKMAFSGYLNADNRNEFISGPGQELRQEPSFTRTVTLDMQAKYKDITIPVKFYTTSDKRFTQQTPDYYSIGFRNHWLEADIGDINPCLDRLALTGVRMRGARVMFKYRTASLQLYYGYMSQSFEGRLETYAAGFGIIPSNLVNDTQYVVPGIYKRWMMAMRLEKVNKKDRYKIGFNIFKAKDDSNSVKYGTEPKDNIAASGDVVMKFFKKAVTLNAGIGASVLTKDTRYGTVTPAYLDTTYHIKLSFNPQSYQSLIILNTSTIPATAKGLNFLAYYTQLICNSKMQQFNIEYRRNGAAFYSLGNPFLRNNYNGVTVSERVNLLQHKISLGGNLQNYSNNLNESSSTTTHTQIYSANASVNLSAKLPSLFVSYMNQARSSTSSLVSTDNRKNTFSNLRATVNMRFINGLFTHDIRAAFNTNSSNDQLNPETKINFNYYSVGIGESFLKKYSFSGDIGKTIIKNATSNRITDIFTYSVFTQCNLLQQKGSVSFGFSNNKNYATVFSNESFRTSLILRGSYKFYKGMNLYLEAGSQPYREALNEQNNFEEKCVYLRYTYDFDFK